MDKLGPVREAVAQKDDDWEKWGLEELVDNLRKYTDRNPLPLVEPSPPRSSDTTPGNRDSHPKREDKLLMSGGTPRQPQWPLPCVYCGLKNHQSSDCTKVLDIASRKEHLTRNKLCYNCTKSGHVASKFVFVTHMQLIRYTFAQNIKVDLLQKPISYFQIQTL